MPSQVSHPPSPFRGEVGSYKIILIRHGQSTWNLENRFTGWMNTPLTDQGKREAAEAGQSLKDADILPDIVFVSPLKRAQETCRLVLATAGSSDIIPQIEPRLAERYYALLTGMNKDEAAAKYGEDQVKIWRRSYDTAPPAAPIDNIYNPENPNNQLGLDTRDFPFPLPDTESLKDVVNRVRPFYETNLDPNRDKDDTILIVAHGNTIRALIMTMCNLSPEEIQNVEIRTGQIVTMDPKQSGWEWTFFQHDHLTSTP